MYQTNDERTLCKHSPVPQLSLELHVSCQSEIRALLVRVLICVAVYAWISPKFQSLKRPEYCTHIRTTSTYPQNPVLVQQEEVLEDVLSLVWDENFVDVHPVLLEASVCFCDYCLTYFCVWGAGLH